MVWYGMLWYGKGEFIYNYCHEFSNAMKESNEPKMILYIAPI